MQVLHVGCGSEPLPAWLGEVTETRLDIEPACNPDIVATMTDLGAIGPFDMVYSSHCLEHLMPYEVPVALSEFRRVLAPGGVVMINVPAALAARCVGAADRAAVVLLVEQGCVFLGGDAVEVVAHIARRSGAPASVHLQLLTAAGAVDRPATG